MPPRACGSGRRPEPASSLDRHTRVAGSYTCTVSNPSATTFESPLPGPRPPTTQNRPSQAAEAAWFRARGMRGRRFQAPVAGLKRAARAAVADPTMPPATKIRSPRTAELAEATARGMSGPVLQRSAVGS